MRRTMTAMGLAALVAACGTLPPPQAVPVTPPPGLSLPVPGTALILISDQDMDRLFSYDLNRITREKTDYKEGEAMALAARDVMAHAFAQVAVNDPDFRPNVIARIGGQADWSQGAATFTVSCHLDATDATGIPIGHFYNTYHSPALASMTASLPRVYAQCLRGPVQDLMASAPVEAQARAGFPAANPVAVDAYLRSQGLVPTR
jgi:hypothetical protein